MSEFAPWMFLVKVKAGYKPRVCLVSPYEALGWTGRARRRPRAWYAAQAGAVAAIGNTVDEAYKLICSLDKNLARELNEVA